MEQSVGYLEWSNRVLGIWNGVTECKVSGME